MGKSSQKIDEITLYIILYYISRLDGVLGKTHLQKLLFLSDLISLKNKNENLTALDYKKYLYGPYSDKLDDYIKELIKKELIAERKLPFQSNPSKKYYRYHLLKNVPIKSKLIEKIGTEKFIILDDIADNYGNMGLQNLLDIVYDLEFVKKSKHNTPLKLAAQLSQEKDLKQEESFIL